MIDYSRIINPTVAEIKPSGIRKFFDIAAANAGNQAAEDGAQQ